MSQYLSFKLVNKTNPDIKIDLGYWCTSIARGISYNFQNIFRYTEDGVKLDYDTLESYIETLHEGIDEYKESLRREQERKRDNIDLLLKAQSEVVVNAIKEDINDNDESIVEWQDEIDTWQSVEDKLNFILDILGENKDEWELVYSNS
jgi:hypothetical protein